MPSIQKVPKGYRAQVYVSGRRDSAMFRTKREADAWAAAREVALRAEVQRSPAERHTLGDAMREYAAKVSPTKRGRRWEEVRIDALIRSPNFPAGEKLSALTPEILAAWRDVRCREVSAGTVLREIGLISAVLETARQEWRWLDANPMRDIRKPRSPDHREVLITRAQIRAMLSAMGYSPRRPVRTVSASVAVCFMLALRSGMRAGELCGLTWGRVAVDYCSLPVTKTVPRDVPLTSKAVRLIEKMRGFDPEFVFGIKSASLDALFRKYRQRAGLSGFTFHDSRHTAATWLARRIDVLDLCRMFGWSSTQQALTYYNPSASSIAGLLNDRHRARLPGRDQSP